jgi:hypothetical protein
MGGQRKSLLKWSQVPIEPVADGERRIDAGQVPKRIRRAVYRLFERDRKRQLGRAATARRRSPAHGEPLAHPPQRTLRQEQSRHDENVSRTRSSLPPRYF